MSKSRTFNDKTGKGSERDLETEEELQRWKIELCGLNGRAECEGITPLSWGERRVTCSKTIGTEVARKTEPTEYI